MSRSGKIWFSMVGAIMIAAFTPVVVRGFLIGRPDIAIGALLTALVVPGSFLAIALAARRDLRRRPDLGEPLSRSSRRSRRERVGRNESMARSALPPESDRRQ